VSLQRQDKVQVKKTHELEHMTAAARGIGVGEGFAGSSPLMDNDAIGRAAAAAAA